MRGCEVAERSRHSECHGSPLATISHPWLIGQNRPISANWLQHGSCGECSILRAAGTTGASTSRAWAFLRVWGSMHFRHTLATDLNN